MRYEDEHRGMFTFRVLTTWKRQCCRACGSMVIPREGTGWAFWFTCNRCKSREADRRIDA